ncbi:MAG: hypothetical protein WB770_08375 [Acidimicrobiales bacterium]
MKIRPGVVAIAVIQLPRDPRYEYRGGHSRHDDGNASCDKEPAVCPERKEQARRRQRLSSAPRACEVRIVFNRAQRRVAALGDPR